MVNVRRSVALFAISSLVVALEPSQTKAHKVRGEMVHEQVVVVPSPGYEPPRPETLGGPFELVDHTGRTVTDKTFRGQWMMLFFGFAGCREVCPVGLDKIGVVLEELGEAASKIQPLFIDLDYEATDKLTMAQFVSNFHPRLLGLTGTRAQKHVILRDYKVRRESKHAVSGKRETGHRIDHSSYFYLVDPEGRTRSYFHHALSPTEMTAIVRRLVVTP
jgi:protein SCO1